MKTTDSQTAQKIAAKRAARACDDARQVQGAFHRFLVVQLRASTRCEGVLSGV